jgi:DNA-binding NarL/FixJ family response regulator
MILIVDDNVTPAAIIAGVITERLAVDVQVVEDLRDVTNPGFDASGFTLALVDLSFRNTTATGLDVLVALQSKHHALPIALYTQGDDAVADLITVCWHAFPLAGAFSKSLPLDGLIARISDVLTKGHCDPDPVLTPLLPSERSPFRSADAFSALVPHAGHAKLWRALQRSESEPSIAEIAGISGLAVNSVKNYREALMADLRLHGLNRPSMNAIRSFAIRCRPLLEPFVSAKLDRQK